MTPTFYDDLVKRVDYLYKVINCINGDCTGFDEIKSVSIDGRNLSILTSSGTIFSNDVDYLFKVDTIAERDTLPGQFNNKIRHSVVWVANTTGDPGDPQPNAFVYDQINDSWSPLVNVPGQSSQTRLVSGNVFWDTDLTFKSTPGISYLITGTLYEIPTEQTITLDAADPTLPRIDVITLDKNLNLGKITGVPSVNPQRPIVDDALVLAVTFVTVDAGVNQPAQVVNYVLYENNVGQPTEAQFLTASPNINPALDTGGDLVIHLDNATDGESFQLVMDTALELDKFNVLLLQLTNLVPQAPGGFGVTVDFQNGATLIHTVQLYDFASLTDVTAQELVLSKTDLGLDIYPPTQLIDNLVFTVRDNAATNAQIHFDSIVLQENGITAPDPSITNHNQLQGIQGGVPGEHYHFSQTEWTQLKALIYNPPTLSLTPATLGSNLEVGDDLVVANETITVNVGFSENVDQGRINISGSVAQDGWQSPIPGSYLINGTFTPTVRGNTTISTAYILRDDTLAQITDTVRISAEYAVVYLPFQNAFGDILNPGVVSDSDLIDIMNGNYVNTAGEETRVLRSNKNLGNITFTPSGGGLSKAVVIHPISYGTAQIASQTFPNSPGVTSIRDFTYSNNGLTTAYRMVVLDSPIGGPYPANIF